MLAPGGRRASCSAAGGGARATGFALLLALALALALASACALTSKHDALPVRYFTPEAVRPRLSSASGPASLSMTHAAARPALCLGRVSSGAHLREKMVHRTARGEIGFSDELRWTEKPEVFVRRQLEHELFEERGFARVFDALAPTLDVEVLAFEELRVPRAPAARVQARVVLHDDHRALLEETLTVDRPVVGERQVQDVVAATAEALEATSSAIADRVAARIVPPAASPSP